MYKQYVRIVPHFFYGKEDHGHDCTHNSQIIVWMLHTMYTEPKPSQPRSPQIEKFENVWNFDGKTWYCQTFRRNMNGRGGKMSWTAVKFKVRFYGCL